MMVGSNGIRMVIRIRLITAAKIMWMILRNHFQNRMEI